MIRIKVWHKLRLFPTRPFISHLLIVRNKTPLECPTCSEQTQKFHNSSSTHNTGRQSINFSQTLRSKFHLRRPGKVFHRDIPRCPSRENQTISALRILKIQNSPKTASNNVANLSYPERLAPLDAPTGAAGPHPKTASATPSISGLGV